MDEMCCDAPHPYPLSTGQKCVSIIGLWPFDTTLKETLALYYPNEVPNTVRNLLVDFGAAITMADKKGQELADEIDRLLPATIIPKHERK